MGFTVARGLVDWQSLTQSVPNGLEPVDAHEGSMACGSP